MAKGESRHVERRSGDKEKKRSKRGKGEGERRGGGGGVRKEGEVRERRELRKAERCGETRTERRRGCGAPMLLNKSVLRNNTRLLFQYLRHASMYYLANVG